MFQLNREIPGQEATLSIDDLQGYIRKAGKDSLFPFNPSTDAENPSASRSGKPTQAK
jgi:hypothetical protein